MEDLPLLDLTSRTPELQEEAKSVLKWAQNKLLKGTFPRTDYREFLELVIVTLGGGRLRGSASNCLARTTRLGGCQSASTS